MVYIIFATPRTTLMLLSDLLFIDTTFRIISLGSIWEKMPLTLMMLPPYSWINSTWDGYNPRS
jgi:hypothetical protein